MDTTKTAASKKTASKKTGKKKRAPWGSKTKKNVNGSDVWKDKYYALLEKHTVVLERQLAQR